LKKWGSAHHDRFVSDAYAKWMDDGVMEDYIILDFRSTDPQVEHGDERRFYC
jgi:hypothetical protein